MATQWCGLVLGTTPKTTGTSPAVYKKTVSDIIANWPFVVSLLRQLNKIHNYQYGFSQVLFWHWRRWLLLPMLTNVCGYPPQGCWGQTILALICNVLYIYIPVYLWSLCLDLSQMSLLYVQLTTQPIVTTSQHGRGSAAILVADFTKDVPCMHVVILPSACHGFHSTFANPYMLFIH